MSDELNNNLNHENSNMINESSNSSNISLDNVLKDNDPNNMIINNQNESINNSTTYSFWAEQISGSAEKQNEYANNQGNNNTAQNYNGYYQNNEQNAENHAFDMSSGSGNENGHGNEKGSGRRKKGVLRKLISGVVRAAVFGVIASATFIGFNTIYYRINPDAAPISIYVGEDNNLLNGFKLSFKQPVSPEKKIAATTVSNNKIQQDTDLTDVVDATMPSIVTITSTFTQSYNFFGQQYNEENSGGGSGIIVGKNDNEILIATNNHVVEGANPITVSFIDDTTAQAVIKGTDALADLAVISIDISTLSEKTLNNIKVANLGDSDAVKVGQMAIAIGNALGYGQSLTVGYISAKDREVAVDDKKMVLLQTDAAINPGNSGGALLNIKGEVIGINTVKYAASEVEGMGFAIPISRAIPIINELMKREILADHEKGFLGIYLDDVTEEVASIYNWPMGVYVKSTFEGGAAEKAGILSGDIITGVNGSKITVSTQLKEKISSSRAGTDVTLTIMRIVNGEFIEKEIVVTLGSVPQTE